MQVAESDVLRYNHSKKGTYLMVALSDPRSQSYYDVEPMIISIVKKYYRPGMDWDELMSVAHEGFTKAYNAYDPSVSKWTTAVWYYVRFQIRCHLRQALNRYHRGGNREVPIARDIAAAPQRIFDLELFAEELSDDGKTVLNLVFDPPAEVVEVAEKKGGHAHNLKSTVKDYLHENLGWTGKRIVESFEEVWAAYTD